MSLDIDTFWLESCLELVEHEGDAVLAVDVVDVLTLQLALRFMLRSMRPASASVT